MKYYVEFKYVGEINRPYNTIGNWIKWQSLGYHNSPSLVLIEIIGLNHLGIVKIDKNLYKFANADGSIYHFRIKFEEGEEGFEDVNRFFLDHKNLEISWIPIGEEITIEKLNGKFISINWNLGLLK